MNLPPPIISAYKVVSLEFKAPPGKAHTLLYITKPQVLNTEQVEAFLMRENTFIVGWQEIHYQEGYLNNGAPYLQDAPVTRQHLENQERIRIIGEKFKEAARNRQVPDIDYRSIEHEAFSYGWKFSYKADVGPYIPDEIELKLNWVTDNKGKGGINEPRLSVPMGNRSASHGLPDDLLQQQALTTCNPPQSALELDKLDILSNKFDTLISLLGNFINEKSNAAPSDELRVPTASVEDD